MIKRRRARRIARSAEEARKATKVVGTGWTAVTVRKVGTLSNSQADQQLKAFVNKLQPVHGSWGSGRLLAGTAFSARCGPTTVGSPSVPCAQT